MSWATENLEEAVRYFRMAASQGHADAQNNLGICYQDGEGVTKNLNEAAYYYSLAAEQGNKIAKSSLRELLTEQPSLVGNKSNFFKDAKTQGDKKPSMSQQREYTIPGGRKFS